jgi:hypothetical protein
MPTTEKTHPLFYALLSFCSCKKEHSQLPDSDLANKFIAF